MVSLGELRIPHMGSVENARVVAWHVEEGAGFSVGQLLYEVETDKTLTEVTADVDGVLARRLAHEGDELKVGELVGWWAAAGSDAGVIAAALAAQPAAPQMAAADTAFTAVSRASAAAAAAPICSADEASQHSPRVRKLAREHGVDLATLRGSGPGGRISGEDVLQAVAARSGGRGSEEQGDPLPAGYEDVPCESRPNSLRRRTIARRLAETARSVPHLTADMQIDMGAVLASRARLNARQPAAPMSVLSLVAAAVCRLLPQHPELNATFTDAHLLCWRVVNLGIAVDTPEGLVVPVLRDAGRMSLEELNGAIATLAARARNGTLRANELEGGTFTISNPGSLGPVLRAEAILNAPQVALLGLPGMVHEPVAVADATNGYRIAVRPLLRPSLTFDHRALDGGHVIRFLNALKRELEQMSG